MLAFSHNNRPYEEREFTGELPFQPLTIHHKPPTKSKSPPRKVLMKTVTGRPVSTAKVTPAATQPQHPDKPWQEAGKLTGLFDTRLRRNQLQQAERRTNKKSFKVFVQEPKPEEQFVQRPIKEVQKKRLVQTAKQSTGQSKQQIEHLKKLIQKEKEEKLKNDRIFEQQQLKLEKERMQLKMIEKQIGKLTRPFEGPLKTEDLMNMARKQNEPKAAPTHDHSPIKQQRGASPQEAARKQENDARRLNQLLTAKEKLTTYNNPLNYTPTLIPLLSRATNKIITSHISTITQLLVDDMLLEEVLMLEQLEQKEQNKRQNQRRMDMVNDYMELVGELVRENDEIQHRLGKFDRVDLPNWYRSDRNKPLERVRPTMNIPEETQLQLAITEPVMASVDRNRRAFQKAIRNLDEYLPENLTMFSQATEQIINEMIDKMEAELDRGAGEFVDVLFRNEFR